MKKAVAFAILILLGIALISASDTTISSDVRTSASEFITYTWSPESLIWNTQQDFNEGDHILLEIEEPDIWGEPPYDIAPEFPPPSADYDGPKFLYVEFNYTPPGEQKAKHTRFESVYYKDVRTDRLVLYDTHIYLNRTPETLLVDKPTQGLLPIGGTTKFSGTYQIFIVGPFPPPEIPQGEPLEWPVGVQFFRISNTVEKPYAMLLPVGIATSVIGGVSLIITLKGRGKRLKVKRRSVTKNR